MWNGNKKNNFHDIAVALGSIASALNGGAPQPEAEAPAKANGEGDRR
jgi:hypothetical protein